jgi:hypothetical protein
MGGVRFSGPGSRSAIEQQFPQLKPVLLPADKVTDVLAAGPIAPLFDLLVDEGLHAIGKGDVHRAHGTEDDS